MQARSSESSTEQKEDISNFFDSLKRLDSLKHREDLIRQREMEQRGMKPRPNVDVDASDRHDRERDDAFFDQIARADMKKSVRHHRSDKSLDALQQELDKQRSIKDRPHAHEAAASRVADEWKFAEKSLGVDKHKSKPQVVKQAVGEHLKVAPQLTAKSPVVASAVKDAAVKAPAAVQEASGSKGEGSNAGLLGETEGKWIKDIESVPLSLFR
ncbi:hypothetical protein GUITHDRAFT_150637 [Guillardia theta CCMP2712]|uniref:Uncharacterized protein n=2 Tax=Guillardia theta TaxID=55529 RepID=L1JXA2_GUITC|nr:hypothetical protein GUITHDRAFT_150637 [Guillardia theta CCMP2712]EKX52728.1 hypothetical protein GUITHDRAFT_150637 [Guillardia theta CCMP2712]|eukprot:XP_005839708.1 hypothetical protein GUITHDRAFT_150637 [Guillardia theta CCMP2712]